MLEGSFWVNRNLPLRRQYAVQVDCGHIVANNFSAGTVPAEGSFTVFGENALADIVGPHVVGALPPTTDYDVKGVSYLELAAGDDAGVGASPCAVPSS